MSALGVAASPGFDEHFNDLEQAQIDPYSPDFIERVNRRRKLKMRAASQQVGPAGSAAAPRSGPKPDLGSSRRATTTLAAASARRQSAMVPMAPHEQSALFRQAGANGGAEGGGTIDEEFESGTDDDGAADGTARTVVGVEQGLDQLRLSAREEAALVLPSASVEAVSLVGLCRSSMQDRQHWPCSPATMQISAAATASAAQASDGAEASGTSRRGSWQQLARRSR